MDGGGNKGQKPRQNSLKKQNSGGSGGYSRNSAPPYQPQQRRGPGPGPGNYGFHNSFRNNENNALMPSSAEGLWGNQALTSLLSNLIGCEVRFRLKDGREYEGIFEAFSPKGEFAFSLCCLLKNGCIPDSKNVEQLVIALFPDIASLSAKAVNIVNLRTEFDTDIGISQKITHGDGDKTRQLEAWEPDADDAGLLELEDDHAEPTSSNGGWSADDMFRKNKPLQEKETKSGILKQPRFQAGEYDGKSVDPFSNVTADESEVTDEIREIAAHIERSSASTVERVRQEQEDTEENFSAVLGNRATWQQRGGANQRGGGRGARGAGQAGRGVQPYPTRKGEPRPPGLAPQLTQQQQQQVSYQQSPQAGPNFNRVQQGPGQGTPPPNAVNQRGGFSPKPSPPPLQPGQQQASQPISYASAAADSQDHHNQNTTNGGTSYSNAAAQHQYSQQPGGSWRKSNPQAIEQQKRDIVHHHQNQLDTMDRAAIVQDLKQTTASIAVSMPEGHEHGSSAAPVTQHAPSRVTVKAGSHHGVHQTDSNATASSGRESLDSVNIADSSHGDLDSRHTPINPSSSTPHPPVSAHSDHHSTSATPSTPSSSAFANALKKLNPLAEEFVPRGPGTVASPAPSSSVSAVQSPTAAPMSSQMAVAAQMIPQVSVLANAAAALPPPTMMPPVVPAVVSVVHPAVVPQPMAAPPQAAPQVPPQNQPPPQQPHNPQTHHQGGQNAHHRGNRQNQQYNQQRQGNDFVPTNASHETSVAPAAPYALPPQPAAVVAAPQVAANWTVMPQQAAAGGAVPAPYAYQIPPTVAAHPQAAAAAAAAVNAARFQNPNNPGQAHQVTVTAQFNRPPAVVPGPPAQSQAPIMYSTTGAQQSGQMVKPGAPEFTPTISFVQAPYVLPQGQPAFYAQSPAGGQVMTIHQAAAMQGQQQQQQQHNSQQQQTPQQAQAQAVAQQIHHQQQLQAQHNQQVQQQQQQLAQQLQQATLNGQLQQAFAQQYQAAAAQAQQQAHQNQQQQLMNAQQQAQAGQNAAHGQTQFATAPQILYYQYPSGAVAAAAAQSGAHQALLAQQAAGAAATTQQQIMATQQFYAANPQYAAMPVVAQQGAQQGATHSNVATPAQTPTGGGPPFLFMTAAGMQGYYPGNFQLVTPQAQVNPGQPATQPSGP